MYEPKLSVPKKKRLRRHEAVLNPQFPVPVASLANESGQDDIWNGYHGEFVRLHSDKSVVRVSEDQDSLQAMGCFGQSSSDKLYRNNKRVNAAQGQGYVALQSVDPQIFDCIQKEDCQSVEIDADSQDSQKFLDLALEEAYFLSYGLGCLTVTHQDENLNLEQMWNLYRSHNARFPVNYAVYHHFRAKGWIVKPGTKFGADFLLYKDGPEFYHASYSILIQTEAVSETWTSLSGINRVTESAAKELILAHVECSSDDVTAANWPSKLTVIEVLVRRWVPSIERETVDQNHLKRDSMK